MGTSGDPVRVSAIGDGTVGMSCDLGWGSTGSLQTAEFCLALLKDLEQDFVSFG